MPEAARRPPRTSAPKTPLDRRVGSALVSARQRCESQGAKFTAPRARVLELLIKRGGTAKAYDLLADLQSKQPGVAPITVYRALDFLVEQGLVHKVAANSSFVVCNHGSHPHTDPVFMVCERCGGATEWHDAAMEQHLASVLASSGFQARGLEIKGECARCQRLER